MDNGISAYEKFVDLDNKKFTDEDIFIRLSYKDKKNKSIGTLKDILRFLKMPFEDKYEPTFELELGKELVKMIYFEEVCCGKVF